MAKIYIDRQRIRENEPAIVVESEDGHKEFCSMVQHRHFTIKQDFSRKIKPVVWIEVEHGHMTLTTTKPECV